MTSPTTPVREFRELPLDAIPLHSEAARRFVWGLPRAMALFMSIAVLSEILQSHLRWSDALNLALVMSVVGLVLRAASCDEPLYGLAEGFLVRRDDAWVLVPWARVAEVWYPVWAFNPVGRVYFLELRGGGVRGEPSDAPTRVYFMPGRAQLAIVEDLRARAGRG